MRKPVARKMVKKKDNEKHNERSTFTYHTNSLADKMTKWSVTHSTQNFQIFFLQVATKNFIKLQNNRITNTKGNFFKISQKQYFSMLRNYKSLLKSDFS